MHRGTSSYHANINLKTKFLEILLSSSIKSTAYNDEEYFKYLHTFTHSLSSGDITQAYIFVALLFVRIFEEEGNKSKLENNV
jgi:hypothetical protein